MKKAILVLCAALALCCFAGCKEYCKEDGCDEEVYEGGYCTYHYNYYQTQQKTQGVLDALFGD